MHLCVASFEAGRVGGRHGVVCRWWAAIGVSFAFAAVGPAPASRAAEVAGAVQPQYRAWLDAPLFATGIGCLVVGRSMSTELQAVPATGLDRGGIHWHVDRNVVGLRDTGSNSVSNWFRDAALVYPMALAAGSAPHGTRVRSTVRRTLLYVESLALAQGVVEIAKSAVSRPRPYTYLSDAERPDHGRYDVGAERAFESLPSGHAASAWCATSFALADHLMTRPEATWKERAALGFAGGVLATTTAALRVESGQHFPSDVVAGAAIGAASGIAVPLVHRYVGRGRTPRPKARAWLQAAAGTAAGVGAGLLLTEAIADP